MTLLESVLLRTNREVISAASGPFIWRVVAVLVIGALLAQWAWELFAPRSVPALPAIQLSSDFQAGHLFGIAPVSVQTVMPVMPNVRLIGVFAGSPGFAVLELDGKRQLGMAVGREIVQGAKLVEVAVDYVVIERGGVRQQIQLEGKDSAIKRAAALAPLVSVEATVNDDSASQQNKKNR